MFLDFVQCQISQSIAILSAFREMSLILYPRISVELCTYIDSNQQELGMFVRIFFWVVVSFSFFRCVSTFRRDMLPPSWVYSEFHSKYWYKPYPKDCKPNVMSEWLAVVIRIWIFAVSDLGLETGCPYPGLSWYSSFLQQVSGSYLKLSHDLILQYPSWFIAHSSPNIRRCRPRVWAANSVVK